jgi:hypothetical protein
MGVLYLEGKGVKKYTAKIKEMLSKCADKIEEAKEILNDLENNRFSINFKRL